MDVPDEDLALAAANGDRAAFSALAARHYDRVFGFAWRITGSRTEAEDLTQDIFAALPAKLAAWRGEARLTTWLYVGSSRVDLQACKLEYSIVSPK